MRALGSPADLITNIGGGAKALVYAPAQGLVQGPAEFFEGVGRGAQSFVKGGMLLFVVIVGAVGAGAGGAANVGVVTVVVSFTGFLMLPFEFVVV